MRLGVEGPLPLRSRGPSTPHYQQLHTHLLAYFYSAPVAWFYSALDTHAPGVIHAQSVPSRSVDASWSFDGGSDETLSDSLAKNGDHLDGFWRRMPGVKGQAREFDGYTTGIWREAKDVPKLPILGFPRIDFPDSRAARINNFLGEWRKHLDSFKEFAAMGIRIPVQKSAHTLFLIVIILMI